MVCSYEDVSEHGICVSQDGEHGECWLGGWQEPVTFWRKHVTILECEAEQSGGLPTSRRYLRDDESSGFLL
jgi:hypothetical protein